MSGTILVLCGPEGSGKSILMTHYGYEHHKKGGEVLAFPGYRLLDDSGEIISKELPLEDWITLDPQKLTNVFILIDEMQNFFDAYRYNSALSNLFAGMETERRKLNTTIIGTVQEFEWLPPRMRRLTHEKGECFDLAWRYHDLAKGTTFAVRFQDLKGFKHGIPGMWSKPKVFHGKKDWNHYDTYAVVDLWERYANIKIHGRKIDIDPYGQGIPNQMMGVEPDMDAINSEIRNLTQRKMNYTESLSKFATGLVKKGINTIPSKEFYSLFLKSTNLNVNPRELGQYMPEHIKKTGRDWQKGVMLQLA